MERIFVKNSSTDVNFGYYELKVEIRTDGGRLYLDRKYWAKLQVDEQSNILRIIVCEEKGGKDGDEQR
jgi:hypothetical protein